MIAQNRHEKLVFRNVIIGMYNSLRYELQIGDTKIKQVQFIYLGSFLTKDGKSNTNSKLHWIGEL